MCRALVLIVSAPIQIIKYEPHTEPFTCVYCKFCREMVFAIVAISCIVIAQIGNGRERIGEKELRDGRDDKVIGLCENELLRRLPVDENAI